MHLWALTGILPNDITYLHIYTDASGLINELRTPVWRSSDAIIKKLIFDWNSYVPEGETPKNIDEFSNYIVTMYGTQTYMVVQLW